VLEGLVGTLQLPSDLMLPPPRALPPWARSGTLVVLLVAASVVLGLAAVFVAVNDGGSAIIPAGLAIVIAGTLIVHVQKRRLLSMGTGAVGRVVSANKAKGVLGVEYEYQTPAGTLRGSTGIDLMRVRTAFGFEPGENDTVYVVFDPAQPSRSAVWGFARR
jgi:hypothetical protein